MHIPKLMASCAVVLLAGCSSAPATAPVTELSPQPPAAAPTTAATTSDAASQTPASVKNARGNVVKQVGDQAAITSNGDTANPTVTFAITKITPNFKCTDEFAQKSANGNFIAVEMEITTAASMADTLGDFWVTQSSFKVIGADGTTENDSMGNALMCIPQKDQIPSMIGPGEHVKGLIILDSSHTSGGLAFSQPLLDSGWEWSF